MSDTLNAITLEGDWVDLNSTYEITNGTTLIIQNQTSSWVEVAISALEPAEDFRGMMIPSDIAFPATVVPDTNPVWVRGNGPISVQVVDAA